MEYEILDNLIDDILPKYLEKIPEPPIHPSIYKQHYPETPEDIRKYADEVEEYNKQYEEYLNKLKSHKDDCKKIYIEWLNELFKVLNIENHPKLKILIALSERYSRPNECKTMYSREHFINVAYTCFELSKLL